MCERCRVDSMRGWRLDFRSIASERLLKMKSRLPCSYAQLIILLTG